MVTDATLKLDVNGATQDIYPRTHAELVTYGNNSTVASKISEIEGDVASIESSLTTETTARTTGDSALNARIDNLLNSSLSDDTEVQDARVNGVNTKTYTSLKNRVDGDFTDLNTKVNEVDSRLSESILEVEKKINITIVKNINELINTTGDQVYVLDNITECSNGSPCLYIKNDIQTFGGVHRKDGTNVFPAVNQNAFAVSNAPVSKIIGILKNWIGNDNITHAPEGDELNANTLYGEECEALDNGKYELDCNTFVCAVLDGITYENSRYSRGKNAENYSKPIYVGTMPTFKDMPRFSHGGSTIVGLASWFAQNGRLYDTPKNVRNLQMGDLLFRAAGNKPHDYLGLTHVAIVIDTIPTANYVVIAECSNASNAQEVENCHITSFKIVDTTTWKYFARPNYINDDSDDRITYNGSVTTFNTKAIPCSLFMRYDNDEAQGRYGGEKYWNEYWASDNYYYPVIPGKILKYKGNMKDRNEKPFFVRAITYDKYYNYVGYTTIAYNTLRDYTIPNGVKYARFCIGTGEQSNSKVTLIECENLVITME